MTVGDFALKMQNWEGNLYLTKNIFSRDEICCAEDNHNYMTYMCEKNSQIKTLIKKLPILSTFQEVAPNFIYLQKS